MLFIPLLLCGQNGTVDDGGLDYDYSEVDIEGGTRYNFSPCTEYTSPGSTVDLWDWRDERYDLVFYQNNNSFPTERSVPSPFFTTGANINHLTFQTGGQGPDFQPSEGWELLYRHLGVAGEPVQEPSFGLYNRLDGRIRILFYIEPNDGGAPNNVLIRMSQFELGITTNVTGLFENLNIPANALENFDKNVSVSGMVQLNEGIAGLQWYVLEGVASYDPCSCQHESSISVSPVLTTISSFNFNMEGTGASEAVYDAGDPRSTLGYITDLSGKITSGYKKYNSFASYEAETQDNEDKTVKVLATALGGFASFAGAVGGVTDLLGFVLGKKSSASPPKLTGYNHNFSFEADGTFETDSPYPPYYFYTPGSYYNENALNAFRPVYDNPLGVMTVLEPPVVELQRTRVIDEVDEYETQDITTIRWRFTGNLRYHINELAGISNQPVQLLASLVWPNTCENDSDFFATPAINLNCLEDFVVEFEDYRETVIDPGTGESYDREYRTGCLGNPQLQIVALLTSTDPTPNQEILYTARYVTEVREVADGTIGTNPFERMTIEEINEACTGIIPDPITDRELSRFCARQYNPQIGSILAEEQIQLKSIVTEQKKLQHKTAVFPNPFTTHLNVSIPSEFINNNVSIEIRDLLGRKVWGVEHLVLDQNHHINYDGISGLPPATYLLIISSKDFAETLTVQKQ